MKTLVNCGLVLGMALSLSANARANLIINGSFENVNDDGNTPIQSRTTVQPGDNTTVPGWTAINGGFDWCRDQKYSAYAGLYSVNFNHAGFGGIAQTFATQAGQQYEVSFALVAPVSSKESSPCPITVSVAGGSYVFAIDTAYIYEAAWKVNTFTFTATSDATTLAFSNELMNWAPVIDDVSVTAVPEPATYLAGLSLLAMMGAAARRKAA